MIELFTEESIDAHREYLRGIKLKYSILEKSIPSIKNKNPNEIIRQKMSAEDKTDTLRLLSEMLLHEVFFSSFGGVRYLPSETVRRSYGSEAALLYRLLREGMNSDYGFLCLYNDDGKIDIAASSDLTRLVIPRTPVLAVDLYEHAYFRDYGFDKDRYLQSALSRLDLSRLEKNPKYT